MLKRIFTSLLLIFLLAFFLMVSTWMNLSSEKITPWVEHQINARLPRVYSIDIGSMETKINGLTLNQIQLNEQESLTRLLDISKITVSINIFKLVVFQEIPYSIELYEGSVEGYLDLFPDMLTAFVIKDVEPNRNSWLRKSNIIRSNPIVEGQGSYFFSATPAAAIDLNIENLSITANNEYTNIPFELPMIELDSLRAAFSMKEMLTEVTISSAGDIDLNINGQITPDLKSITRTQLNLIAKGQLKSDFENELGFVKQLLDSYRNSSKQISVQVTGTLQHPIVRKI